MNSQNPGRKSIDRLIAVRSSGQRGFTLVELVTFLAMLAVLAAMVPLGMARSRTNGREIVCVNNVQQLMGAAQMYAEDNVGQLPGNYVGLEASGNPRWARGRLDWIDSSDNTNIAYIADEEYASLAGYLKRNPKVFKCPSDNYLSPVQRTLGWTQRVRTYSASLGVGEGNAEYGQVDKIYKHVRKMSEFIYPPPAETWVYTEEHPDSMNDPAFISPTISFWCDLPAGYHNGGGSFGFADGHAETHRWTDSVLRYWYVKVISFGGLGTRIEDRDIQWMRYHTSRVSPGS
jgi:prepilin-type processing-associated H-X9-DG protein